MLRYPSPILFHGPGAEQAARAKATVLGRLLHEPFGESGLKIAESREVVDLMNSAPVGDDPGVLIIGPMDRATRSAQDVLLKNLEEFDETIVRPVLWAYDEADVLSTIRSRCLRQWCTAELPYDEDTRYQARGLVSCALKNDVAGVIETVKDRDPRSMLEAVAQILLEQGLEEDTLVLWDRVRDALRFKKPSMNELLATFLDPLQETGT